MTNTLFNENAALREALAFSAMPEQVRLAQEYKAAFGTESRQTGLKLRPGAVRQVKAEQAGAKALPQQRQTFEGLPPGAEGDIRHVLDNKAAYQFTRNDQLAFVERLGRFFDDLNAWEDGHGIKYDAMNEYYPQFWQEQNPLNRLSEFREPPHRKFEMVNGRLMARPTFTRARVYPDLETGLLDGKMPRYGTFAEDLASRLASSAKAVANKITLDKADAQGDEAKIRLDTMLNPHSLYELPVFRQMAQTGHVVTRTILGLDAALTLHRAAIPALSDYSGRRLGQVGHMALPDLLRQDPFTTTEGLQRLVPRMFSQSGRVAEIADHFTTYSDIKAHGGHPFLNPLGLSTSLGDHSPYGRPIALPPGAPAAVQTGVRAIYGPAEVFGKLSNFITRAQFEGVLPSLYRVHYEQLTDAIIGNNSKFYQGPTLHPELHAGLADMLHPQLMAAVKPGMTPGQIKFAITEFLDTYYGHMDPSALGITGLTSELEHMAFLAPTWARSKVGALGALTRNDMQGQLARDITARALAPYILLGTLATYALTGQTMNVTDPTASDFMGVKLGDGTAVRPWNWYFGPALAAWKAAAKGDMAPLKAWGYGQSNPLVQMPLELARDATIYGNTPITTLGENALGSQGRYLITKALSIPAQEALQLQQEGAFTPTHMALRGFGFTVSTMSPRQLVIFASLRQAAVAGGVPSGQADALVSAHRSPIGAVGPDGKWLLQDQAQAKADAFRIAQTQDPTITREEFDHLGYPTAKNREAQEQEYRGYVKERTDETALMNAQITAVSQRAEARQLTPEAARQEFKNILVQHRVQRAALDAKINNWAAQNHAEDYVRQQQQATLDKKSQDTLLRETFLYGSQGPDGQAQPGWLSPDFFDPLTGAVDYKARDGFLSAARLAYGVPVVERWMRSGSNDLPAYFTEWLAGLERYRGYFGLRDILSQGLSQDGQNYLKALEFFAQSTDPQDAVAHTSLERSAPQEVKVLNAQIRWAKEGLRATTPGLDEWLLKYGYNKTPIGMTKGAPAKVAP